MKIIYAVMFILFDFVKYFQHTILRAHWRSKDVFIARKASFTIDSFGEVNIAHGVYIADGVLIVATTENTSVKTAQLDIGENTVLNEYSNIRASGGRIVIGANTMIAQGVSIIATNHKINTDKLMIREQWDLTKSNVRIGDNVWIGANCVILPGVNISSGAVIAAGAVVNKDIGINEIWGGVPARLISIRKTASQDNDKA
ncbi:acyltransferase [Paraglaciecola sp. 20A4]|uniref:acyltransferase n=1 Tax=Paraglaciecola sp. 20A4 TaxID=2687288 RepID=UPI0023F89B96|nr:acyltransferase [Paraglaciecola sp. 20A4]